MLCSIGAKSVDVEDGCIEETCIVLFCHSIFVKRIWNETYREKPVELTSYIEMVNYLNEIWVVVVNQKAKIGNKTNLFVIVKTSQIPIDNCVGSAIGFLDKEEIKIKLKPLHTIDQTIATQQNKLSFDIFKQSTLDKKTIWKLQMYMYTTNFSQYVVCAQSRSIFCQALTSTLFSNSILNSSLFSLHAQLVLSAVSSKPSLVLSQRNLAVISSWIKFKHIDKIAKPKRQ